MKFFNKLKKYFALVLAAGVLMGSSQCVVKSVATLPLSDKNLECVRECVQKQLEPVGDEPRSEFAVTPESLNRFLSKNQKASISIQQLENMYADYLGITRKLDENLYTTGVREWAKKKSLYSMLETNFILQIIILECIKKLDNNHSLLKRFERVKRRLMHARCEKIYADWQFL